MLHNDGRVISNFIVQGLRGEKLTIQGDGSQTRSFCYIDDLINGMRKFMDNKSKGPLNLGNPNELSIKELTHLIIKKLNNNLEIEYIELPKDDPTRRKPDINLAQKTINWEPTIDLDEGLNKTIDYFKKNLIRD